MIITSGFFKPINSRKFSMHVSTSILLVPFNWRFLCFHSKATSKTSLKRISKVECAEYESRENRQEKYGCGTRAAWAVFQERWCLCSVTPGSRGVDGNTISRAIQIEWILTDASMLKGWAGPQLHGADLERGEQHWWSFYREPHTATSLLASGCRH